eukprot:c13981_g1_i1.p1 GENE.c13981_g1_i1~~c13981_g1_i1.p1  ORF type:complete len:174 (+),score=64.93 c13981_g1_i1:39-524(+)
MSRSTAGTRKTTSNINSSSPKYIGRPQVSMEKQGSRKNGTDAAHKMGYGLVNVIETHSPGRALSGSSRNQLAREMNSAENLRIKSEYGNRVLDERRDARIANSYVNQTPIQGKTTAERAYQVYQGAQTLSNPKYGNAIGEMRVQNPETGGYYKVKNFSNYN